MKRLLLLTIAVTRLASAGPLITAKEVSAACAIFPTPMTIYGTPNTAGLKNVTVTLNPLTNSFYFANGGLVFTFTPATGDPIVYSLASGPTVFGLLAGKYSLVIHDRTASGKAGPNGSQPYDVSVSKCVLNPSPKAPSKMDPATKIQ